MIEDRILVSEQQFSEYQQKREEYLKLADECMTEMTKLQGEYRVLTELRDAEKKPNKKATVIEAVPEKEG